MKPSQKRIAAIYIHVPFCVKKCSYCDFFSHTDFSMIPDYLTCLEKEISQRSKPGQEVDTIYFGGGTPSVLTPDQILHILDTLHHHFEVQPDTEITLEMNPGTITHNYFPSLKQAGVNRLSIGVQSFDDKKLKFLGRVHSASQAAESITLAKDAGFNNLSLDLIYGLPFETPSQWRLDLERALLHAPRHLSCYMLTVEDGTPLKIQEENGAFIPLDDAVRFHLFEDTVRYLEARGYDHYEISNFAKGLNSRSGHNSKYWAMTPYLGFGPAAHSFDGNQRSWNVRDIGRYVDMLSSSRPAVAESEILSTNQKILETIMLSLRTSQGLDVARFNTEFDTDFYDRFMGTVESICQQGFAKTSQSRFALTLDGKIRLDSIVEAFADKIL